MSSVNRPKRPLPQRVYWTRRLLVLGLGLALVFGVGQLIGTEPQGSATPSAKPAAGAPSAASAGVTPSVGSTNDPTDPGEGSKKKRTPRATKTPLALPTGPCSDDDVRITPAVKGKAYAGSNVAITLDLTTLEAPACNWEVSSSSVVLRLTSGSDRVWSTQDCPSALNSQSVVVRKENAAQVDVVWSGQRSDDECSRTTLWAEPGYYYAAAAALGAEPVEQQFELLAPLRPRITKTPETQQTKPKERD